MNNNNDSNKMASWIKVIVLGVGAAGALFGAVKYLWNPTEQSHRSGRCSRGNSSRKRSPAREVAQKECEICSEISDELVVFLPCLHTFACIDCGAIMRKCIKCRGAIVERITEETNKTIPYRSPKANEDLTCPICFDNKRRIIFNCGHTVCKLCAEKVDQCPVCREIITTRNNFF